MLCPRRCPDVHNELNIAGIPVLQMVEDLLPQRKHRDKKIAQTDCKL